MFVYCFSSISTAVRAPSNSSSIKAFGEEKVHRQWEAIQHDSLLMDTVHDSWLGWSFGGHWTGFNFNIVLIKVCFLAKWVQA